MSKIGKENIFISIHVSAVSLTLQLMLTLFSPICIPLSIIFFTVMSSANFIKEIFRLKKIFFFKILLLFCQTVFFVTRTSTLWVNKAISQVWEMIFLVFQPRLERKERKVCQLFAEVFSYAWRIILKMFFGEKKFFKKTCRSEYFSRKPIKICCFTNV